MMATYRKMTRRGERRRGTAIVELAIVLPILVLILFGIIEFGHAFLVRHNMISAAAQGARFGTLPNVTAEMVTARVQQLLDETGMGSYPIDIAVTFNPPPTASTTVRVKVGWEDIAIFSGFVSNSVTLAYENTQFQ